MPLVYTNRRGQKYYLLEGKTKSGKPKYFASKNPECTSGVRCEMLPDEFRPLHQASLKLCPLCPHPLSALWHVGGMPARDVND